VPPGHVFVYIYIYILHPKHGLDPGALEAGWLACWNGCIYIYRERERERDLYIYLL